MYETMPTSRPSIVGRVFSNINSLFYQYMLDLTGIRPAMPQLQTPEDVFGRACWYQTS
jgi:hypothetical protein